MRKEIKTVNFWIAIIAILGMLWISLVLRFYMLMLLIILWPLSVFIFLLYLYSFLQTIITSFISGFKNNKYKIIIHISFIFIASILYISSTEIFKSKVILKANYQEDLFSYWLKFREDGTCENYIIGFAGYEETIKGSYKLQGDTIIFTKKPYDNDFITDTMIINNNDSIIYTLKEYPSRFKITIDERKK